MTWDGVALDASIVRDVWCSVPDALYNLARHGLAHRDVTPGNLCMNAKNKTTVLID
jgi:tRNA A-37 threonylcarbamoyl transferase component Bud32